MSTPADQALISYARGRGQTVTQRQLKRWRALGLLPARRRRGLGRGRGIEATDPPWARFQVLAVLDALEHGRSASDATLRLWYQGWDIPTSAVWDVVESRVTADRRRYAQLEAQATALFGAIGAFEVLELDSNELPVTRAELDRMRSLASDSDTPGQLVHAARVALQGQLLSPPEEPIAIDDDMLARYLDVDRFRPLFAELGAPINLALREVAQGIQAAPPEAVLATPTEAQLDDARWRLRRFAEASDLLQGAAQDDIPRNLVELLTAMLEGMTSFDPARPDYTPEALITALRVMPAVRPERVEFSE